MRFCNMQAKGGLSTLFVIVSTLGIFSAIAAQAQAPGGGSPTMSIHAGGGGDRNAPYSVAERVVQGVVKDANQKGVAGAEVHLKDLRTSKDRVLLADKDGAYVFSALPLEHDYQVWVQQEKRRTPARSVSSLIQTYKVTINFKTEDLQVPGEEQSATPAAATPAVKTQK